MAETNARIHVLADETLGGINREYVEVDRKAEVGEKIIVSSIETHNMRDMTVGNVYDVISGSGAGVTSVLVKDDVGDEAYADHSGYLVLEPTDIIIVNGQRFGMVNDNAEKGAMVIVTDSYDFPVGHIDTVKEVDDDRPDGSVYLVEGANGETYLDRSAEEYRVLVPVEAVEDEPQPADPIDVIASLAQEVASLKRTVDRHRDEIDTLYKDKRTLGEELARLKEPAKTEERAPIDAPLVFVQRKIGDVFDVYQDGKRLRGIKRIRIDAAMEEFTTHEIEFVSGATEEERP